MKKRHSADSASTSKPTKKPRRNQASSAGPPPPFMPELNLFCVFVDSISEAGARHRRRVDEADARNYQGGQALRLHNDYDSPADVQCFCGEFYPDTYWALRLMRRRALKLFITIWYVIPFAYGLVNDIF